MIAKKGKPRKDGRKGFKELAKYVVNPAKTNLVRITNCGSTDSDMDMAIHEIEATQALNTRAKGDKSYHLIVSFPEGEFPSPQQLAIVEQRLCDSMGVGDHQRISGFHLDTDNPHLHVAINLVHPRTYAKATPFRDFYHRDRVCRELELELGLQRDNGIHVITDDGAIKKRTGGKQGGGSEKAKLIETHQGIESFESWLGKEPANALSQVLEQPGLTWQDLHDSLGRYSLKLVKRGNGLALVDMDNPQWAAKASAVGRFFTKSALERQLGEFQEADPSRKISDVGKIRYIERPVQEANIERNEHRNRLYRDYIAAKAARQTERSAAYQAHAESRKERFAKLGGEFKQRRETIKISGHSPAKKKAQYKLLAMDRVLAEQQLRGELATEREDLSRKYGGRGESYREFVVRQSNSGDEAALAILRSMKPKDESVESQSYSIVTGSTQGIKDSIYAERQFKGRSVDYRVRQDGNVLYLLAGRESLRDEGRLIHIADQKDADSIELGLRLAQKKFGKVLALNGSAEFKRQAVEIAVANHMKVEFSDPALQQYKLELEADAVNQRKAARSAAFPAPALKEQSVEAFIQERGRSQQRLDVTKGQYQGEVLHLMADYVVQDVGRNEVVVHSKSSFNPVPKVGQSMSVHYRNGQAVVRLQGKERRGRTR